MALSIALTPPCPDRRERRLDRILGGIKRKLREKAFFDKKTKSFLFKFVKGNKKRQQKGFM